MPRKRTDYAPTHPVQSARAQDVLSVTRVVREYGDRWRYGQAVEKMAAEGWAVESTDVIRKRKGSRWLAFGLLGWLFVKGDVFRVTYVRADQ